MKKISSLLLVLLSSILVVACNKKAPEASASQSVDTPVVALASAPANVPAVPLEETAQQKEAAKKRSLMDYSNMEEKYLTDTLGQWATSAKASSAFGDANSSEKGILEAAAQATKVPDTKIWTNNNYELGFDWLELTYVKPVQATEIRVVLDNGKGVEAISKIELQDESGKWNIVWADISDVKEDTRGRRTWFVKSFEKTKYKVKAVKISLANNLEHSYKAIDAVQLIGE
jgi:hypothetical protein